MAACFGLACGASNPGEPTGDASAPGGPDGSVVDAGPSDAGPLDSGACAVTTTATSVTVGEGSRVEVPLQLIGGDAVTASVSAGLEVSADGAAVTIWAGYGPRRAQQLTLSLPCGARLEIPVLVRPLRFRALASWTPGATSGPDAREHPILFIDPTQPDHLLLLGGFGFTPTQFSLRSDLWDFDLVAERWTPRTLRNPPRRAGGRVATVPDRREAYVWGGSDETGAAVLGLDRLTWTGTVAEATPVALQASPQVLPSQLGSLVWDAPRGRLISACGFSSSAPHCQVVAIDPLSGQVQILRPDGDAPSPRYGFFVAHDVEAQRLILFSGGQRPRPGNPINPAVDVWSLALDAPGATWTYLLDAPVEVPGRRNGCAAFDPVGQRLFVWGGTPDGRNTAEGLVVITLRPGAESVRRLEVPLALPERSSCSGIYDPARKRMLFGFGNTMSGIFADLVALE